MKLLNMYILPHSLVALIVFTAHYNAFLHWPIVLPKGSTMLGPVSYLEREAKISRSAISYCQLLSRHHLNEAQDAAERYIHALHHVWQLYILAPLLC